MRACITALALLLSAASSAQAEKKIRADRSPLTFRDAGLYCNISMRHGKDPNPGNMLPVDRAASPEAPWSFYVIQANYNAPDPRDSDSLQPQVIATVRRMAAHGKKVILRVHVGRLDPDPNVDEIEQWIVKLFEHIDPDWLYAITLGEEQVFWNGWTDALTRLYYRVKARWPDLPVYQWWTPPVAIDVRATGGWVALPADGWLIDLYGLRGPIFERKLVKFLEAGKPVVHIAWASPTWLNPTLSGADNWERGQEILDEQLAVCRAYDVPVAYFCTQPGGKDEEGKPFNIRWGWHAADPVVRGFYRRLEARAMNLRHLHKDSIGYRKVHAGMFAWARAPREPVGVTYSLDEQDRKQASITCPLEKVATEPGTHLVPTPDVRPKLTVHCTLEDSARDLDAGLRVRSVQGRVVTVPILIRIDPAQPMAFQSITARIGATPDLGGRVRIQWSADGSHWSEPVESGPKPAPPMLSLSLPGQELASKPVWVRIELVADAGVDTGICSTLTSLRVTAVFEPALQEIPIQTSASLRRRAELPRGRRSEVPRSVRIGEARRYNPGKAP